MPKKLKGSRWGEDAAGLQASVIGFVLVGSTALGFGLGWWLDKQFGTAFWMPLLAMFGVAAGFAQMFRMIGEINRSAKERKEERAREEDELFAVHPSIAKPQVEVEPKQQPIFRVPPPPQSSWEKKAQVAEEPLDANELAELDSAELIERLLDEGKDEDDETSSGVKT